jgi:glycerophosphoryl diester phosphodiesterase
VARKIVKLFLFLFVGVLVIMSIIYGSLATTKGEPATEYGFFKQETKKPLVIAHRGGAGLYPENTLQAFQNASDLGVDVLELDVRSTSDGTLVVLHDATVDRTTDAAGKVNEKTLDEVKKLNAGFRFSTDQGKTYPHRGGKFSIPTLREVFSAFPAMKFNIEPKQAEPSIIAPLCELIKEFKLTDKVVIGSFNQTILDEFRSGCPQVATSAGPSEASKFLAMYKTGLSESYSPAMQALQIPEKLAGVQVVTKEFVEAAHERNLEVHVWTVNETADMRRLLDIGVDGIMTDYPDRLIHLLNGNFQNKQF